MASKDVEEVAKRMVGRGNVFSHSGNYSVYSVQAGYELLHVMPKLYLCAPKYFQLEFVLKQTDRCSAVFMDSITPLFKLL